MTSRVGILLAVIVGGLGWAQPAFAQLPFIYQGGFQPQGDPFNRSTSPSRIETYYPTYSATVSPSYGGGFTTQPTNRQFYDSAIVPKLDPAIAAETRREMNQFSQQGAYPLASQFYAPGTQPDQYSFYRSTTPAYSYQRPRDPVLPPIYGGGRSFQQPYSTPFAPESFGTFSNPSYYDKPGYGGAYGTGR
jgi:hypothetical protein